VPERFPSVAASASDGATNARASSKGPLGERRKGAPDECRSDEKTHFASAVSSVREPVFAKRDEQVGDQRPCASATQQMGEAPVKYELTGAS
jgi:hypothetical protein